MRNIYIFSLLLLTSVTVSAQKIDQRLTRLVKQTAKSRSQVTASLDPKVVDKTIAVRYNADGTIAAFSAVATLSEGAKCPVKRLEQMGIKVRYQIGQRVALAVPADKLLLLEEVDEFDYVKADIMAQPANDLARQETKANLLGDAAATGLPKAYTGSGVVLGIIDKAIDFNHAAFRNADGSTRIKKAYVFTSNTGDGVIYKPEEIQKLTADTQSGSHGTHVAAIAAGSDVGNGQQGVAPQVDLVLCGLGDYTTGTNIAGCIDEIFKYADEVGKPAVVSISLGNVLGLHDGSDDVPYAVGQLTSNGTKPGRAVLICTMNSATNWQSVVKPGTTKTVLGSATYPTTDTPDMPVAYLAKYSFYASDYKDFDIQLKMVDVTTGAVSEVGNHVIDVKTGTVKSEFGLIKDDNVQTAQAGVKAVEYTLDCQSAPVVLDDVKYRLCIIATASDGQTIKMMCNGDIYKEPCFDAPNDGGYDFAANGWTKGNGDFAFNFMVCNDAVISVGSYITRTSWNNYLDSPQDYPKSILTGKVLQLGEISDFSGYGIDDNGKQYPTILAPGQGIISAASSYDAELFANGLPNTANKDAVANLCQSVDKHDRQNWYMLEQGTSMACPHAAGIVALWMQAKPTLTVNEIKDILKTTSVNDTWTTDVANIPSGNKIQAGYGKIDALAGLKKILGIDGIETISIDGHREATPATMYSVDAPVYNMQGQRVSKNHKGLVIYKGRVYLNK